MKKITRKNLSELALVMLKIGEREQRSYVGGGSGTADDPYTLADYLRMSGNGTWDGGFVEGWGYTFADVTVYGNYGGPSTGGYGYDGNGSYYDPWGYDPWGNYNPYYYGDAGGATYYESYYYGDNSSNNSNYGAFNIYDAVSYLTNNALAKSIGNCAKYVRYAIEAGGLSTVGHPTPACDYETYLVTIGFSVVDSANYTPQAGDIIVHEAKDGHKYGHIAMYSGEEWISDFVQNDMYGGSAYRNNPDYTILRWNP